MKLEILFEDDDYIFVNKPSGILAVADRHNDAIASIVNELRKIRPTIYTVHRIDRETTGCICYAKNENAHKYASQLFEHRKVIKKYQGIVYGTPPTTGMIEDAIMEHPTIKGKMMVHAKQGKPSKTEYEVLESYGNFSFLLYTLHTGRTHQIRLHSSNIGHPLLCDGLYGNDKPIYISSLKKNYYLSKQEEEERPMLQRIALHAFQLSFDNEKGEKLSVEAPLPKDMRAFLNQCKKWLK